MNTSARNQVFWWKSVI